ncbi:ATP-binding protein [Streptomyces sp. SRF1]|uniref:ATP-binding protein n=1 Tax=Streptomyces sp. SRF1 TaxID=1549642 RepID=UPI0025B1EE72|nr:ATP-binding protein [Streptomyces sp. SRF1]MDN3061234.1 ATP-binding protein [Streptomyces sp. SRF1]
MRPTAVNAVTMRERQDCSSLGTPEMSDNGDAMKVRFEIAKRGTHDQLAEADARRVKEMRYLTKACLEHWGLAAMSDDVVLAASELVTNAILHSHGAEITLSISLQDDDLLRLSVHDETPWLPVIRRVDGDAESGRGLQLVEWMTIAHNGAWGTSDGGATTWCTFSIAAERGRW